MFKSKGLKRFISSALLAVTGILQAIPGIAEIISVLGIGAGVFGAVGVAHAVPANCAVSPQQNDVSTC